MRVLFVSCDPHDGAVTRYRCTYLARALKSQGHTADVATIYDLRIAIDHDVVVLHRICANREGQALADAVRKSGAALIYGADDLVFDNGLHNVMLQQADAVLVSTDALAELASEAGAKQVGVVRNVATPTEIPLLTLRESIRGPLKGTLNILYPSGTPTHDADLAQIGSALATCLVRFPEMRLVLMGDVQLPELPIAQKAQIITLPWMDWNTYITIVRCCDVVIAPLAPTRFNRGKSELKWLEAAIQSRPTVASHWGGFSETVENGIDGLLAATEEEWIASLTHLIENTQQREAIGKAAFERVVRQKEYADQQIHSFFGAFPLQQKKSQQRIVNSLGWSKGWLKHLKKWQSHR